MLHTSHTLFNTLGLKQLVVYYGSRKRELKFYVYYESLKREIKTKTIYGFRCDERIKTKVEESPRLAYYLFIIMNR